MILFLAGSDPQIPYFLGNGAYIPTTIIHAVPSIANTTAIPERAIIKDATQWTNDDKRPINIDTKARFLLSMSLPNDVFHYFFPSKVCLGYLEHSLCPI